MPEETLRLLIFGAHPDDADFHAGGTAALYRGMGHVVKMISMTNGDAGHHEMAGAELARIRRAEAEAAGRIIGADYVTWDHGDGHLQPTLDVRWQVVREIRAFRPHLILAHRPVDYHPDHRAVGQVVCDASYLVTVPGICRDDPPLAHMPVIGYLPDRFEKPTRLAGDVVIDVGGPFETILDMLACHRSQVYEWLPYSWGVLDHVPADEAGKRAWLRQQYARRLRPMADRYRRQLVAAYGAERGAAIEFAEVFEVSEYGSPLDDAARRRLFPFLP